MNTATLPNVPAPSKNGQKKTKKADKIIKKFTIISTGSGLIPNPVASVGATVGAQLFMIKDLCELFKVSYEEQQTAVLINSVIGGVLTKAISMVVSTLIPNNSATNGPDFSGAAICGLYTATVGEYYKDHFQSGGNLENATLSDLGDYFMAEIQRGDIGLSSFTNPSSIMTRLIK